MAGFQLKMAIQHGEKVAAEFGFNQFPIKPREIAKARDIVIQAKPAEVKGVSGAIVFAGNWPPSSTRPSTATRDLKISPSPMSWDIGSCRGIPRRSSKVVAHICPAPILHKYVDRAGS